MESFSLDCKYFAITSFGADPQGEAQASDQVYAQFEANFDRETHDGIVGDNKVKQKASNKGKHLMIFNDRSGSMAGTPFNCLQ